MKQTEATITESFHAVLEGVENNVMRNLRVGTLARVLSVSGRLLSVEPIIKEKINTQDGYKYLKLPIINGVYCISNQNPKVGDYVICVHFDRGIGGFDIFKNKTGYIESGTHRHDISDCVAIVINTEDVVQGWAKIGEFPAKLNNWVVPDLAKYNILRIVTKVPLNGLVYQSNTGEYYIEDGNSILQEYTNTNDAKYNGSWTIVVMGDTSYVGATFRPDIEDNNAVLVVYGK